MSALTVRKIGAGARVSDWIAVPPLVHANDPQFVRELDLKERMRVAKRFNPFFDFGEAGLFVAYRDGRPVGRISAHVNRLHRERHDPHSGHFGFFCAINDQAVANALFDAARTWLKAHDATSITGPFSFSVNEESGLLVDGFDEPAAMLMNQALPYMGGLVEAAGLTPVMNTYAFRLRQAQSLGALDRIAAAAKANGEITLRPIRVDRFADEVRLVIDIFNDAWSGNWGFVPFTDPEIVAMIRELKPFYRANYGSFVELRGEPVGFLLAIPDVNGLIKPFNGALLPFNWWRLLSALKNERIKSARIPLMGLRKSVQGTPLAAGALAMLASAFMQQARAYNLDWVEFSWVLETNRPMMEFARLVAGKPAKQYRYYSAPL
jgi:hypothetical protein